MVSLHKAATVAALAALLPAVSIAVASDWEGIPTHLEYGKRVQSAQSLSTLGADSFGDSISLYNGATEFVVSDIELPGNSALRVDLTRRHAVELQPQGVHGYDQRYGGLGNWDIQLPHIGFTYPDSSALPDNRCSSNPTPRVPSAFLLAEVWNGISVHIPGRGTEPLMTAGPLVPVPTSGGPYYYSTRARDVVDCIPMKSGLAGQGFRLITAQGIKYYFDVAVRRTASKLERRIFNGEGFSFNYRVPRTRYVLLPSRVEDRHGNLVEYSYSAEGFPTQIFANDGRSIELQYSGVRLTSATAHGKTWKYEYSAYGGLSAVRRPDGSAWHYSYTGDLEPYAGGIDSLPPMPYCTHDAPILDVVYQVRATHPSGLEGLFDFVNTRHYRSGVHANECYAFNLQSNYEPDYTLVNAHYSDVLSLARKAFSGLGVPGSMSWDYDFHASPGNYETLWGSYGGSEAYPCTTCNPHKVVVVRNPDGTRQRHTFGKLYLVNEGRPLRAETLDTAGAVVRDEKTQYLPDALAGAQLFHPSYGGVLGGLGDRTHTYIRPVVERTTVQDGTTFYWRVKSTCGSGQTYCFDSFARPTVVDKGSAPGS